MLKIIKKYQYAPREVLTIVGEDYQDIYKANKINWQKGALKTEDKNTQVNECPNRMPY